MRYLIGILLFLFVSSLWGVWYFWYKSPNGKPHHHYFHKHTESDRPGHRHFYEYRQVVKPPQNHESNQ
jgi:hypothetical protein